MMNRCRLIAVDMDGTLLNDAKEITPAVRAAIRRAAEQGVETVFCTGRCSRELLSSFQQVPEVHYAVCCSGAYLYDAREACERFPHRMPWPLVEQILDIMEPRDTLEQILFRGAPYFTREKLERLDDYRVPGYYGHFHATGIFCENAVTVCREAREDVDKICFYHTSPEARDESRRLLAGLPLTLADAEETSLEVSPTGVDKGTGLAELCGFLGIPLSETCAMGDSYNDLTMLRSAGCAIAVGNARAEVKAVCDAVVADCNHDGAAEAVEKVLEAWK